MGHLRPLFQTYKDLLVANGYLETKGWPYAYDYFDNGVKIPDMARKTYSALGAETNEFENPFHTEGANSFFYCLKHGRLKGPFHYRLWSSFKRVAAACVRRVFGHNQRLLYGLSMISQGIEVILGISYGPSHNSPVAVPKKPAEQKR
jgi:hypothetical protein